MGNQQVSIQVAEGLEGVAVGETAISNVEGAKGRLSYRGERIEDLVAKPFLEVVWLVLFGEYPSANEAGELQKFLDQHGQLSATEIALLAALPLDTHPMLMLQSLVPVLELRSQCPLAAPLSPEDTHSGLIVAAKIPSLIAAWHRLQQGLEMVPYPATGNIHENFLVQFNGHTPSQKQLSTLDKTQILQMEHSFNAGTFAGRVAASTLAPIQSVISVSIGTLFGKLHGGADQAALEMAQEIGSPELAAAYVRQMLQDKKKIMGMGHREYSVVDPRAKLLLPMAKALCDDEESRCLLQTLEAIEAACQIHFSAKGKEIWANVEFYKGAVFHALGIPAHFFTAIFAMARVYGYVAHFLEFQQNSRLIRPQAIYVGR